MSPSAEILSYLVSTVGALLPIVNPFSTGVTRSRVAGVTAALIPHAEVDVRQTERRGHATELAAAAADASAAPRAFRAPSASAG